MDGSLRKLMRKTLERVTVMNKIYDRYVDGLNKFKNLRDMLEKNQYLFVKYKFVDAYNKIMKNFDEIVKECEDIKNTIFAVIDNIAQMKIISIVDVENPEDVLNTYKMKIDDLQTQLYSTLRDSKIYALRMDLIFNVSNIVENMYSVTSSVDSLKFNKIINELLLWFEEMFKGLIWCSEIIFDLADIKNYIQNAIIELKERSL